MSAADCGRTFDHEKHLYRDAEDLIRSCDGSVTKAEEQR